MDESDGKKTTQIALSPYSLCDTVTSSENLLLLKFSLAWQPWLYPSLSDQPCHGYDLFTVAKDEKPKRVQAHPRQEACLNPKRPDHCLFSLSASHFGSNGESE